MEGADGGHGVWPLEPQEVGNHPFNLARRKREGKTMTSGSLV
jgi:hypothetical protein